MHQNALAFVVEAMAIEDSSKNLAPNATPPEPSPHLLGAILESIAARKRRAAQKRLVFWVALFAISAIGCIPALLFLKNESSASGFLQSLSLLFSDPMVVLLDWQEFTLSLLELLPVTALGVILVTLFALLGSLRATVREMPQAFRSHGIV